MSSSKVSYSEHRVHDLVINFLLLYHNLTAIVMFKNSSALLFKYEQNSMLFKGKVYNEGLYT